MMSTETIISLARQVAVRAAAYELEPYMPAGIEEIRAWKRYPMPNIGSYRPKGWVLVDTRLVDKTGFGTEGEPALTFQETVEFCAATLEEDPQAGFAWVEEGPFQVVLGYFTQEGSPASDGVEPDLHQEYEIAWCPACGEPYEEGDTCLCGYDPDEEDEYDDEEEDQYIREGIDAYRSGQPSSANPYPCPSLEHEAWEAGWFVGKLQEVERMREDGQPSLGI